MSNVIEAITQVFRYPAARCSCAETASPFLIGGSSAGRLDYVQSDEGMQRAVRNFEIFQRLSSRQPQPPLTACTRRRSA
jgi:hypothetical protein